MSEQTKIEWWQKFSARMKFPDWGTWLIAPEEDGEGSLVHGETMTVIPINFDKGETPADAAEFFRKVWPKARVSAPTMVATAPEKVGSCDECTRKDECAQTKAEDCPWLIQANKSLSGPEPAAGSGYAGGTGST